MAGGTVNPDEWHLFKPILAEGENAIIAYKALEGLIRP